MKKILLASCSILLFSNICFAAEESKSESPIPGTFSGSLTGVSDYVFRGISQSDNRPAVQGAVNYVLNTDVVDVYAGLWGSSVNFNDNSEATLETDWSAGVRKTIGKLSLDAGLIYYSYPGADKDLNYDYTEGQIALSYDFDVLALNASINYTPENFAKSGEAIYYKAGFSVPTPIKVTFDGHLGRQQIHNEGAFGAPDYTDWALGAAYNFNGFDFKLEYTDTDIDKDECDTNCEAKAVLTVSHSF